MLLPLLFGTSVESLSRWSLLIFLLDVMFLFVGLNVV